jgi:hypothetical protein
VWNFQALDENVIEIENRNMMSGTDVMRMYAVCVSVCGDVVDLKVKGGTWLGDDEGEEDGGGDSDD